MRRSFPVAAGLCVIAALAVPAIADTRSFSAQYSVAAGKEVEVGHYSWPQYPSCSDQGVEIKVVKPPEHGKIDVRTDNFEFKSGSDQRCIGKTVSGSFVYYQPADGFHGDDQFEFTIQWSALTVDKTVNVTVN